MMDDLIGLIFAVMTTGIRCVRFQSWGGELNIGYQIEETTGAHCAKLGRVFEVHIQYKCKLGETTCTHCLQGWGV